MNTHQQTPAGNPLGPVHGAKAQNTDDVKAKTPPDQADKTPTTPTGAIAELGAKVDNLATKVSGNADLVAQVDGMKTAIDQLTTTMGSWEENAGPADWSQRVQAMTDRMDAIDAKISMPGAGADGAKTVGELVHAADGFKSGYLDEGGAVNVPHGNYGPGIKIPSQLVHGAKTGEVMHSIFGPGAYRPEVFSPTQNAMNFAQRLMYIPAPGAANWQGARETEASTHGAVTTTLAVAVTNPSTTCEVADANGFLKGAWCRFFNDSGTRLIRAKLLDVDYDLNILTFDTGELAFAASVGWRVICESFAAVIAKGAKHYGHLEVEPFTENFQTLPTMLAVTEQMLATAPGLTAWVEQKLKARAQRNLSMHVFHGDGGARSLDGFDNDPNAQSYAWSAGTPGDTMVDAVFRASTMIPWAGEIVVALNKLDLMKIATTKGTDGHYIKSTILGDVVLTPLMGRMMLGPWEIVLDDAVYETDFYLNNLAECSELVDQQRSQLKWGYIGTQFGENVITARYEDNLIHSIQSPGAYVLGDFDGAPAIP